VDRTAPELSELTFSSTRESTKKGTTGKNGAPEESQKKEDSADIKIPFVRPWCVEIGATVEYCVNCVRHNKTVLSQSGGLYHVAHSFMRADKTNSVSSLIVDMTYIVTSYVMTRLKMGTRLSKSPPPRSDWPHEDYFVSQPF
jgi:hypothetical protein